MTSRALTKRVNLFLLTVLLIGQTILAPLSTSYIAYAESDNETDEQAENVSEEQSSTKEDESEADEEKSTNEDEAEKKEKSNSDDQNAVEETKSNDEEKSSNEKKSSNEAKDEQSKKEVDKNKSPPADEKKGDEKEGEVEKTSKAKNKLTADEKTDYIFAEEIELNNKHIESFTFKVNGKEYTESTTIDGVSNEDSFELSIKLKDLHFDEDDLNFGPGTVLKYPLPEGFSNHFTYEKTLGSLSGYGDAKIVNDNIEITLTDSILDDAGTPTPIENGRFNIQGNFSDNNEDWSKEIALPGGDKITVNFVPKSGEGVTIDKEDGQPNKNGQKSDEIEWKVTVNTDLKNTSDNPVFKDTLSASGSNGEETGHTYKKDSVKVYEIDVKPSGVTSDRKDVTNELTPTFNDDDNPTEMSIPLEKGKAYEITYTTIPDNPGINERVTYENSASYDGSNDTGSTRVEFGKAIEKTTSGPNTDLETEWTIKYNYNEQNIPKGTVVTDKWTVSGVTSSVDTKQILIGGNDGITIERADSGSGTPNYSVNYNEEAQKFELTFEESFDYPINIKYKTKPNDELKVDENFTVKNEAEHGLIETIDSKTVNYRTTDLTLKKNKVDSLDYDTKTMKWKITANQAGYQLKSGDKFIDEFRNENMKLVEDSLTVKFGGTTVEKDTDYTLTVNDDGYGFEIVLLRDTDAQVVIEYTTSFEEIKGTTDDNRKENYWNDVTLIAQELPNNPTDYDYFIPRNKHKNNGSKDGSYNYETKEFTWTIIFNYNSNTLENAILKDELPEEHKITEATLEKGSINSGGTFVADNDQSDVKDPSSIKGSNSFKLNLGKIEQPYKLVYTTKMRDDVLPVDGKGNYSVENKAELLDGETSNAEWEKKVNVSHSTNVLDEKQGKQVDNSDLIEWNFKYNTAQSKLTNVKITDTFQDDPDMKAPNQVLIEDSLKVYKVKISQHGSLDLRAELLTEDDYTVSFNKDDATFVLEFEELDYGIYVEYNSVFIGTDKSPISNELKVTYNDGEESSADSNVTDMDFNYGAFASTSAGEFVIIKTDEATGEPLEGVEFTLKRGSRDIISGTTDENGVLDFGMKFATGKYSLVEKTLDGYVQPEEAHEFTLTTDGVTGGEFDGKQIVNVTNTPENAELCENFTIKVNDIDGKADRDTEITLTNKATGETFTKTTDDDGKIAFDREDLPAGKYTVTKGEVELDEITVQYNENCDEAVIVQPDRSNVCEDFTITLKVNDEPRAGEELSIKDGDKVIATETTNEEGSFTVPSKDLPAGTYDVYKGEKKIGTVDVSYLDDCKAEIDLLPINEICEKDTVTIKDYNNKPIAEKDVTIVDKDGKEVFKGQTNEAGKVSVEGLEENKEYTVIIDREVIGSFTKDIIECEYEVTQPEPETCPKFTITVIENGKTAKPGIELTFKSEDGKEEITGTTNEDGQIIFKDSDLSEGKYTVYKDGKDLATIDVDLEYKKGCEAEVDITLSETCENFTITLKVNEKPREGEKLSIVVKDGDVNSEDDVIVTETTNKDCQIEVSTENLPAGTYDVYKDGKKIGTVDVSYLDDCKAEIDLLPINEICEKDTVTIKDYNEDPIAKKDVTIVDKDGKEVFKGQTNEAGKVSVEGLEVNKEYTVIIDEEEIGSFTKDIFECEYEVTQPEPKTCPKFTITVKENGETVESGIELTFKSEDGKEITGITNEDGQIIFKDSDLPEGEYTVYKDGKDLATIDVDLEYKKGCKAEVDIALSETCENFTITLKVNEKPREGEELSIVVKDGDVNNKDDVIVTETTNEDGQIEVSIENLPAGTYDVYKDGKKIGKVDVSYLDDCKAEIDLLPINEICEKDTVTIKDYNEDPIAEKDVTIVDKDGKEVFKGQTDKAGKVSVKGLEENEEYTVIIDGEKIGSFTKDIFECEYVVTQPEPEVEDSEKEETPKKEETSKDTESDKEESPEVCEEDYIIIKVTENGENPGKDVTYTFKSGDYEFTVVTDKDGNIVFSKEDLPEGEYTVYKDGKEVGTFIVDHDECEIDLALELVEDTKGTILPKTATNMFNIAVIGLILLTVGTIFIYRRKTA